MTDAVQIQSIPPSDPTQFLTYRIVRLHYALNAQASDILETVAGITLGQWRVIAMVGSGSAKHSRDLVRKLGLDAGLISRTIRMLEEKGYLKAQRADVDRRTLQLELTPKGSAIFERTLPHMQERQLSLIEALDPSERQAVVRILEKLEMAAERRAFP